MGELTATLEHDGVTYNAEMCHINKTRLGREDHGIFTAYLDVDLQHGSTGIGGFALDDIPPERAPGAGRRRPGTANGMDWIIKVIDAVVGEYGTWEQLAGKRCLALYADDTRPYDRAGFNCKGIASVDGKRVVIFAEVFHS